MADFMVSLITHDKTASVLEPSCGKGIFLTKLQEHGFINWDAYEIDETLAQDMERVRHESFVSSPTSDKYDVVIGNPPYIRWKNLEQDLKEELQHSALWNQYFNSLCDYLFIFILKSIEQLKDGGELIFICSDYWMNTTHSQTLRDYMCRNGYFDRIYHFKEAPLFEGVCASFVIFRYVKSKERNSSIGLYTYNKKGKPGSEDLNSGTCFDIHEIPQFEPHQRWLLASRQTQDKLAAFESSCAKHQDLFDTEMHLIGDVCDIGNGMVSGLDAAFKVTDEEESIFNDAEKECLIHVLKAKNLDSYNHTSSERYIYMPPNISEDEFVATYPHFVTHFERYIEDLQKRYNYGKNLAYWEFAFPRSKALFEKPMAKIFIPCKERISHKQYFRFCYSPIGYYPLQDVTGIVRKKNCRESVEYILAYLNNERVFDWLRFNGVVKGEIVEFSEAPIARTPYRMIDWNDEEEVHIHDRITEETSSFLKDKNKTHQKNINHLFNILFHEQHRL